MRILISGSSGLVGEALIPELIARGHKIGRLVRRRADRAKGEVFWNPSQGALDKSALEQFAPEAVVHLAGENIASGRWSARRKKEIKESRVEGTLVLARALAHLSQKPKVLISASAIGYYGSREDELLDETSAAGHNFLAEICQAWEKNTEPAQSAGIRTVHLRTGIVLSRKGGALKKMLTPFQLGAGGILGNGRQWMSWIAIQDLVQIIVYALEHDSLSGPLNAVAPYPVTNREFTKTLGRSLKLFGFLPFRPPTLIPLPASNLRMIFGSEFADEMLLGSARVQPKRLVEAGFRFQYPQLREALQAVLAK